MGAVFNAYGRALLSQLHGKMLLLSVLPGLMSVALWALLLWAGLQPLIDHVQQLFADHHAFELSGNVLAMFGLGVLKTVIVPLIAMLLLLPLMILTALLFMALVAMPAVVRHVAGRNYAELEEKCGGSTLGSLGTALRASAVFVLLWCLTLPLTVFPPLALLAQAGLWAWLTCQVFVYDALAAHASADERADILRCRRWPLLGIGLVSALAGAVPGIVWIGGTVASVVLFPFLAAVSIWLYVLIFIFTGLWFSHYTLHALAELRAQQESATWQSD